MIHVPRIIPEPATLTANAAQWARQLCQERVGWYASGSLGEKPEARKKRYGHSEIQTALKTLFGSKCCYCEGEVAAVSHQHVEHFRPQSIYPALAYRWDNLLLACEKCNAHFKRDRFPLLPDYRQPTENSFDPGAQDGSDDAVLINPCTEDPAKHFDFQGQFLVCHGKRAEVTRDICGLDREELNKAREGWLRAVDLGIASLKLAQDVGNVVRTEEGAEFLRWLAFSLDAPFKAMTRARITAAGIDLTKLT